MIVDEGEERGSKQGNGRLQARHHREDLPQLGLHHHLGQDRPDHDGREAAQKPRTGSNKENPAIGGEADYDEASYL